jgi:IS1 family transposase
LWKTKAERPANVSDVWTWTGIDADSKLIVAWFIGSRDADAAWVFMRNLASSTHEPRAANDGRPQSHLDAVDGAFGAMIDYAMLVKQYGTAPEAEKRYSPPVCLGTERTVIHSNPNPTHISTSYVERQMRMSMRRFTRLTNAFSKKFKNHCHMVALYAAWYNFVRIHKTLKVTPAMEAGVTDRLWSLGDIVQIVDEWERENAQLRESSSGA